METTKMGAFIDSLMKGYIPGNFTFTINTEPNAWICIDGKQRIISILHFFTNKTSWVCTDDVGTDMVIYFNHIPEDMQKEKNCICLDKEQQKFFLERPVIVVTYNNLNYSVQCELFNRIQHSMVATSGEQCFSLFRNPIVASKFKEFCRKNDYIDRTRFRNVDIILNILYMNNNRELKFMSGQKEKRKFIHKLNELEEYERAVKLIKDDLAVYFSEDMMAHKKISDKKITKNFVITLFYLFSLENKKPSQYEKKDFPNIQKNICKIWDKWNIIDGELNKNRSKTTTKVLEQIKNIYNKNKGLFIHNASDGNSSDDNVSDNNTSDDNISDGNASDDNASDGNASDNKVSKVSKPIKTPITTTKSSKNVKNTKTKNNTSDDNTESDSEEILQKTKTSKIHIEKNGKKQNKH